MKELSPEQAELFAGNENELIVNSLSLLSPAVAKYLVTGKLLPLSLCQVPDRLVTTIQTEKALFTWGKGPPQNIVIDTIERIDDRTADAIGNIRGVFMNNLKELDAVAARGLSKISGDLSLKGLPDLNEEAAAALGKSECSLYLDGLTHVSDSVAKLLFRHEIGFFSLNGLQSLSEAGALTLGRANGTLFLSSLRIRPEITSAFG